MLRPANVMIRFGIDGVYGKVYEIVRIDEVNEAVHVAGKSV